MWEHEDIEIFIPTSSGQEERGESDYTLFFDGACAKQACSGGMILREKEKLIAGKYIFFGDNFGGNNIAEGTCLVEALKWV